MKRLSTIAVTIGMAFSLCGFGVSYWAVIRFEPRLYHYLFITLGLAAAIFGFFQAFRALRLGRVEVKQPAVAFFFNSIGTIATLYGFSQAFRGLHRLPQGWESTIGFLLVAIGLAGALYGFLHAYRLIVPRLTFKRAM